MTPKQEAFCKAFIETGNASEAYRRAYNAENMAANTINVKASELMASGNISVRIDELKEIVTAEWVWKRRDSLDVLAEIARNKEDASNARIGAVKELNSMHGYNAPVKNQHAFTGPNGEPLNVIINTIYVKPEPRA